MRVTFCGVRGSTPAPGPDFIRFGGNTSCVALSRDGDGPSLLLDGGTGLRRLSQILGDCPFRGTLLLTHLHWDHVQGLPFFLSGDRDDARVTLLLPAQDGPSDAEVLLARMMSPPFFPIEPRQLRGEWRFGLVPVGPFEAEGFTVMPMEVPHKGGRTLGFRVTDGRTSVAYIPDHCPTALGDGPGGVGEYHEAVLELARDVDVLIHDSHLRAEEVAAEGSFGHAAAEYAVGLGQAAGAKRVALFHHRPDRTDTEVEKTLSRFTASSVPVLGAEEGMSLTL
ncbi:MAG TPA: MBL fold metallo-hydrolase [Acidimicrobiales bacterium]|nr:MBL fold metallo-hydrolase [Acidimicrobiales bacterium]